MKKQFLLAIACIMFTGSLMAFDVTFSVDMTGAPAFTTPEVNGNFNGWCGGCAPMTNVGGNVWEVTITALSGVIEWKYAADSWAIQETLTPGSSCTVTAGAFTNRTMNVSANATLPTVCWQSCFFCGYVPPTYPVVFSVDMGQVVDPFTQPTVNISSDGFCGNCHPLTNVGGTIWETTLMLEDGTYEYKFAADNWNIQENLIPGSACTITTGPFTNRVMTVSGAGQTLPNVCWGHCVDCASVLPYYNVTFQVDMSQASGFTTPELNGNFNGWCGNCTAMTNMGGGIWAVTVSLQAGTYEYKFSHDAWAGQENLTPGSSCTITTGPNTNRQVVITGAATLPVVCYGLCTTCPSPQPVTFQVDMSNETGFTIPELNGNFNGWCGNCAPMTDMGGGIWEITVMLAPGTYEYKFSHDAWLGQETLTPGSPCTVNGPPFVNRVVTVPNSPLALPLVCYGSCSLCNAVPANVTFQVDMNQVSGFTTPELNANFNGWCGNCAQMSNMGGGIWSITLPLAPGTYEYKFSHDAWLGQETLTAGSPCTVNGPPFVNRSLTVGATDITLPVVCYGSCSSCVYPTNDGVATAQNVQSTGLAYPSSNCFTGTLVGATVSPQGNPGTVQPAGGQDVWYKVVLPTSAIRVSLNTGFDAVISLHDAAYTFIDNENVNPGTGNEILTTNGLTPGTYYVAVRSFAGAVGPFTVCIQALMQSSCDDGSGTYDLCTNFKPDYTGANQYIFHFTPTSFVGPTVSASSSSQIPLSSAGLGLRHGESYEVTVDGLFNVANGGGTPDPQTVIGSEVCFITIAAHADLRTKLSQRCPATVLKGTTLQGKPFVCAAVNHTITFREVGDCLGTDIGAVAFTSTTSGASPTKKLSQVSGVQSGKWYEVTWRPNFSYGPGVPGTTDIIYVAGSTSEEGEVAMDSEFASELGIYPNPNDGNSVVINGTEFNESIGVVRIIDATGRIVYFEQIAIDRTFSKVITFNNELVSGLYLVEFS
ncbi:MAG: T9SS type A sorting domain-containing protein, partial [Flavobacteriales bacterium]